MSWNAGGEWPDWSNQTAAVVATGPSVLIEPLHLGRDRVRFIAIKSSWHLAPWSDVLYGSDKGWWIANHGAREFKGLRVSASPSVAKVYGTRLVKLAPQARIQTDGRLGGNHSGLQAINLAIRFGARRILMVGFDMTLKYGGRCFDGEAGVRQVDAKRIEAWRVAMDGMAPQFEALGIEMINCCMRSELVAYPKIRFEDALG